MQVTMSNKYENVCTHLGPHSTHRTSPICLGKTEVGPVSPERPVNVSMGERAGIRRNWGESLNKRILTPFFFFLELTPGKSLQNSGSERWWEGMEGQSTGSK